MFLISILPSSRKDKKLVANFCPCKTRDCCKGKEDYERKRQRDLSEKIKKKEKEQQLEKRELFLMNKEDYRTIEIQLKMELEKENLRKLMERERKLKLQEEKLELQEELNKYKMILD